MAYKNLNKAVPRIEGADKVSGKMRYAADIPFPLRCRRRFCARRCLTLAFSASTRARR